jgi:hypothetical protein
VSLLVYYLPRTIGQEGHHRSNGVVTNPLNLLRWWPMLTDHPFSSSSILPPAGTENPRVGGSIPSQATKLRALARRLSSEAFA